MSIQIEVSDAERAAVLNAVIALNKLEHCTSMSLRDISEASGLKITKVRHVVEDLLEQKLIKRYNVSDKPIRPRYYYTLSITSTDFLENAANKK